MIGFRSLDHLALTFANVEVTCDFYVEQLGMELVDFGVIRRVLAVGERKINLHQKGPSSSPRPKTRRRDRPISAC